MCETCAAFSISGGHDDSKSRADNQPWTQNLVGSRLCTVPAPTKTDTFYKGDKFVCSLGEGTNFSFVACHGWKGIRHGKLAEIQGFDKLIGGSK